MATTLPESENTLLGAMVITPAWSSDDPRQFVPVRPRAARAITTHASVRCEGGVQGRRLTTMAKRTALARQCRTWQ